jgi:hypothetical protein
MPQHPCASPSPLPQEQGPSLSVTSHLICKLPHPCPQKVSSPSSPSPQERGPSLCHQPPRLKCEGGFFCFLTTPSPSACACRVPGVSLFLAPRPPNTNLRYVIASTLPTLPAICGVTQKVPARRLKKAKQFQDARTQRQVSEPSSPPVSTAIPPHAPPQFAHAHLSSVPRTGHYNPISVPSAAHTGHEHKPRSSKLSEDDDDFAPVS